MNMQLSPALALVLMDASYLPPNVLESLRSRCSAALMNL